MPPKKQPTIWKAEPHTLAKIAILEGYLQAWFPILGRRSLGQELLYIDGFAGPGRYTNHPTGSPIAALSAARQALSGAGAAWRAGDIHCVLIERDARRFAHLCEYVEAFLDVPQLQVHPLKMSFVQGLAEIKRQMPASFRQSWPLFVFADPFGPTGIPFSAVRDILGSARSEVLINFDVDAVARIFSAGADANHQTVLNDIYGDESWKPALAASPMFDARCQHALDLYMARLRSIPNVRYVFPFGMSTSSSLTDYFLIFASQHHRGLEKMKEAMRGIDQTGEYRFSDAHVGQARLFRFDNPEDFSPRLLQRFAGKTVSYDAVRDFALNETPFPNPKSMLKLLEQQGQIVVDSTNPKRRKGTFPDDTITAIQFKEGGSDG